MKKLLHIVLPVFGLLTVYSVRAQEETNYYKSQDPILQQNSNTVIFQENSTEPESVIIIRIPEEEYLSQEGQQGTGSAEAAEEQETPDSSSLSTSNSSASNQPEIKPRISRQPPAMAPVQPNEETVDESVLSFNVIYMLIKNFKIEEILD